jgi:hypothetical protein
MIVLEPLEVDDEGLRKLLDARALESGHGLADLLAEVGVFALHPFPLRSHQAQVQPCS